MTAVNRIASQATDISSQTLASEHLAGQIIIGFVILRVCYRTFGGATRWVGISMTADVARKMFKL